jgi:diguanylate cyclase (GGDEF)-like protein
VIALSAVVAVPYSYWLLAADDFGMRVAIISAAYSVLCMDAAWSMLRGAPVRARLTYRFTGLSFLFASLYLAARALGGWSGAYGASLFVASPGIEVLFTICANVAYTGCAVGMILASNTQLWHHAESMALLDSLTNLPNRRYFLDHLLAAEARALATGQQLGIIYLDLDGFKAVNDKWGHAVGDALLQSVSTSMAGAIRAGDCVARLGGDEFVVLAEHVESRDQVVALARRLKEAIEQAPVPGTNHELVRVSMGVAVFPLDGSSAHDAMREADAAMYKTKRQARWAQPVAQ